MPKPDDNTLTCLRCKLPIYGKHELRAVVRLSQGVMHGTCYTQHWQQVEQIIRDAIAAGTHAPPRKELHV